MKYLNIAVLIAAFLLSGCLQKDKGTLRIDSLSVDGDEFYCFQKIKMWMCVESDNLFIADYEWGCDDGHFTEGQGFSEACWIPHTVGKHEVWCKVTVGKNTETRYRTMNVSHYFFDFFENTVRDGSLSITSAKRSRPLTWAEQSGMTNTVNVNEGYWSCRLNIANEATRYVNRSFTADPDLTAPFSCRATIGWTSNMPADTVTVGTRTAPATIGYRFVVDRALDVTGAYVDQIDFAWYPRSAASTDVLPLDPTGSGEKCNGMFSFRKTGDGSTVTLPRIWFYHPELESEAAEYKKVAFNLTEDYKVTIWVEGMKVFETDAIKTWRSNNNVTGKFLIREWRIPLPNANGNGSAIPATATIPTFYLACTLAQNTGYEFTGAATEKP